MFQHDRERLGDYCGETVHLIPHFTDAVIQWVEQVARIPVDGTLERPDVCIIEVASLPCGEGNGLTVLQQKETRRKKERCSVLLTRRSCQTTSSAFQISVSQFYEVSDEFLLDIVLILLF
ncbi:unnamed protein product [Cylicocyclus nassatus]|uniref:CTP synthase N-terminal domain-containing protein n=1 Tax=Cylicocyclus nassatus TaxID=53992 RepID=A0AA36H2S6_CYLNA|nr:unnamed protein product [Cylicocyclus nassatus]